MNPAQVGKGFEQCRFASSIFTDEYRYRRGKGDGLGLLKDGEIERIAIPGGKSLRMKGNMF
jgi:hypothetical protein